MEILIFMNKYKFITGLSILVFFIAVFFIAITISNRKTDDLYNQYPRLKKSDSLNGQITHKFNYYDNGLRDPGSASLIAIDDRKYTVIADGILNSTGYGINEIIEVGCLISKKENSDTLIVKSSNGKRYIFLRRNKLYE